MNIYYINKYARLKGPFDIKDFHNNKIIQVGDVCIRESIDGYSFMLVISTTNKWSACKCIEKVSGELDIEGNVLLFTFDGINKRQGNKVVLEQLAQLFKSYPLHDFFINAIDILTYKCDLWNISIYKSMHLSSNFKITKESHLCIKSDKCTTTIFESYLSTTTRHLFKELYSQGKSLREIYQTIKEKHPNEFRQALILFLNDNPNSTIYDAPCM